ncbi:MAG: TnpV protein [Defluviitaleaceae bacterium]|nr:TnpV protein [Defluviitaleaceae bacterium]
MSERITYTQVGDYLLPDLILSEPPPEAAQPLGRYARMRKAFLKDHRTITYNSMLLKETLFPHLRETEEAAVLRMEQVMRILTERRQLPDKETDPMGWAAQMNMLRSQAEEMVLNELVYAY